MTNKLIFAIVVLLLLFGAGVFIYGYLNRTAKVSEEAPAGDFTLEPAGEGEEQQQEQSQSSPRAETAPIYPGAERSTDENEFATVDLDGAKFTASLYITKVDAERVVDFYKEELGAAAQVSDASFLSEGGKQITSGEPGAPVVYIYPKGDRTFIRIVTVR